MTFPRGLAWAIVPLICTAAVCADDPPVKRLDRFGDPLPAGVLARMGTVRLRHGGAAQLIALLPFRHQILAFSHQGRKSYIAFGSARRHLRQRFRGLGTLCTLRGLEHLAL